MYNTTFFHSRQNQDLLNMTCTDIEMGGITSAAEETGLTEDVQSIVDEVVQQNKSKKPRARPLCGNCQVALAVPKIRQKRKKHVDNDRKLANFKKCQDAKNNSLAFNALKKALADLLVSKITGRFKTEEATKVSKIESELARLAPIIEEIEQRRKTKRRAPKPIAPSTKDAKTTDDFSPRTSPVPPIMSDFSDIEADTLDTDLNDVGELTVEFSQEDQSVQVKSSPTILDTLRRAAPIVHEEVLLPRKTPKIEPELQVTNLEPRKKRVRATATRESMAPMKRQRPIG